MSSITFDMFLTLIDETNKHFQENTSDENINYFIFGPSKVGKTTLLATARRPVYIFQFDPGGSRVEGLRKGIKEGWIIVDSRYEQDDPKDPKKWDLFTKDVKTKKKTGFFDHVGTVVVDSLTTMNKVAMNHVLSQAKRAGTHPYQQDWPIQMAYVYNLITLLLQTNCDTIFLAHDDLQKDELTGAITYEPLVSGKHRRQLPILFDELLVMGAKKNGKNVERYILTQPVQRYKSVGSRIGGTKFKDEMAPDLRAMREIAGFPMEDKPYK